MKKRPYAILSPSASWGLLWALDAEEENVPYLYLSIPTNAISAALPAVIAAYIKKLNHAVDILLWFWALWTWWGSREVEQTWTQIRWSLRKSRGMFSFGRFLGLGLFFYYFWFCSCFVSCLFALPFLGELFLIFSWARGWKYRFRSHPAKDFFYIQSGIYKWNN